MENQTIDITKITDLELLKVTVDISNQLQSLNANYSLVIAEYNRRNDLVQAAKEKEEKEL